MRRTDKQRHHPRAHMSPALLELAVVVPRILRPRAALAGAVATATPILMQRADAPDLSPVRWIRGRVIRTRDWESLVRPADHASVREALSSGRGDRVVIVSLGAWINDQWAGEPEAPSRLQSATVERKTWRHHR